MSILVDGYVGVFWASGTFFADWDTSQVKRIIAFNFHHRYTLNSKILCAVNFSSLSISTVYACLCATVMGSDVVAICLHHISVIVTVESDSWMNTNKLFISILDTVSKL